VHIALTVILLSLLPRLLVGAPAGANVCVADGHVAVNCHDDPVDDCPQQTDDAFARTPSGDPGDCIDIRGVDADRRDDHSAALPAAPDAPLPAIAWIVPVCAPAPLPAAATPVTRATSCHTLCRSIVLRC
jgi:hypothetical protein